MAENPAAVAYEAYGRSTGGKNYQGLPMPAWQDLPQPIQSAWWAAVQAVLAWADQSAFQIVTQGYRRIE